uniref:Talin_middle domain-containing protein n=1 Tax=Steinernema glaseri TaxID=37863 RepID=A0A1I7YEY5_9BILA
MKELANQKSPARSAPIGADGDKVTLLNESRKLAAGCKNMVRSVSEGHPDQRSAATVHYVVESADRVTAAAETIVAKSGSSVFNAQLMTAKTEQMLNALTDTVAHLRQAEGKDPFGSETKELIRSSTTLAATLTQLLATARTMK